MNEESKKEEGIIEKKETVEISKELFEDLKGRLDKQEKDIKQLLQVADRKRMSLWYQRHKEDTPPLIKLRTLEVDGTKKIVVGWRTVTDEVYKDSATNRWIERQEIEVMFEDNTVQKIPLVDFNRRFEYVECKRLGTITDDKTGELLFKLSRLSDGKEYQIGAQFVN